MKSFGIDNSSRQGDADLIFRLTSRSLFRIQSNIWDKVFKNKPSKILEDSF